MEDPQHWMEKYDVGDLLSFSMASLLNGKRLKVRYALRSRGLLTFAYVIFTKSESKVARNACTLVTITWNQAELFCV